MKTTQIVVQSLNSKAHTKALTSLHDRDLCWGLHGSQKDLRISFFSCNEITLESAPKMKGVSAFAIVTEDCESFRFLNFRDGIEIDISHRPDIALALLNDEMAVSLDQVHSVLECSNCDCVATTLTESAASCFPIPLYAA